MYLPLILFFLSLIGIIGMISRKLALVKNGEAVNIQHPHPFVPDLIKIKHFTFKSIKRFGYAVVFFTLKFFIKFSNFIKNKSKMFTREIKEKLRKNKDNILNETIQNKETSKYLKIISEYRVKIRTMKHKIKEEEGVE